ncbi:MAG: GTP pyrophosphokinase family protein [Promicromonosporaceae bacterium]|nr:GTP pyrophosphokinase family protein [Promicromonosporaceae bacterium]
MTGGFDRLLQLHGEALAVVFARIDEVRRQIEREDGFEVIDQVRSRIKTPQSIENKLRGLGLEPTCAHAQEHLRDIAGIRIIALYAKAVESLVRALRTLPDLTIVTEKDYIGCPKPSGYRSYHLIVAVQIEGEPVFVEIQLRTQAMDFWASLEHKVRYKYHGHIPQHLSDELAKVADQIAQLDQRMFLIQEIISLINE